MTSKIAHRIVALHADGRQGGRVSIANRLPMGPPLQTMPDTQTGQQTLTDPACHTATSETRGGSSRRQFRTRFAKVSLTNHCVRVSLDPVAVNPSARGLKAEKWSTARILS
jgi:hypothetical protein